MEIKSFNNFKTNESVTTCKATSMKGEVTLYRLTTHPVVNLSKPGQFYFSNVNKIDPEKLKSKSRKELFIITVKCDSSNIDVKKSEIECVKLDCDCIVVVKSDSKCELISVEPYKKSK